MNPRVLLLIAVFTNCCTGCVTTARITSSVHSEQNVTKITFDAEVDENSVNPTIAAIAEANERGDKAILIEFDTPGGYVSEGFRLAKAIEQSTIPVVCVVDGKAASMGFYLLQSCTVRAMTLRSVLMAHEPATGSNFYGQKGDWFSVYERLRVLSLAMNHHMAARLNISYEEFCKRIDGKDWWMTAEEAQAVAAVDQVVSSVDILLQATQAVVSPEPVYL